MEKIKEIIESISPVLIRPTSSSLTIGLSKRFFLFNMMNKIINIIEEDPHLNFIALLKSYKILGRILNGTLHEFYRDRNKLYFKNFFYDRELYGLVKSDIEDMYPKYKDIKMTITKRGVIVYDNYNKASFNTLLLTVHAGTWVPENIQKKLSISKNDRYKEEDVATDMIYRKLVLNNSGIWIDNKQSRFVVDFNRPLKTAIYADHSEKWLDIIWTEKPAKKESDAILASYREFYFILKRLLDTYQFNIIFDGHSMKDTDDRPNISFGTRYIPKFYMPIVKSMKRKMSSLGYSPVALNKPYGGGFILKWLNILYPNVFIFSMEVNKKLYMTKNRRTVLKKKTDKLSLDIVNIFDIEISEE